MSCPEIPTLTFISLIKDRRKKSLLIINHGVNQHTKTLSGIQDDSKDFFPSTLSLPLFGAFLSVWRISGSTIWIWRKPTRNKDPTGGLNISWLRLSDWLTCSHKACSSWAWASCCRRPKPLTSISRTTWSATTAASSAKETVRSARCVLCSTWTSCPTPNVSQRDNGSTTVDQRWRIDEGFVSGVTFSFLFLFLMIYF